MKAAQKIAAAALTLLALTAQAFPIAEPGTEGFVVVVGSTGPVVATYQGNSASFSNNLFLGSTFIFNNHITPVGTTFLLGSFAAGTELIFRLDVTNTGNQFFTGPASRNPDQHEHARVQGDWMPGETLVSFEDLFGGPFNYNDLSFSFTNTVSLPAVPEPETYALLLVGLSVLGAVARRRRSA